MYRKPRYTPKKLPKNRNHHRVASPTSTLGTLTSNLLNAPQIGKLTAAQDALLGIENTSHQGSKIKLLMPYSIPPQSNPPEQCLARVVHKA